VTDPRVAPAPVLLAQDRALKPAVAALLREAGEQLVLPRFQNLQAVDIKTKTSDTDLVTIVDHETEAWLTPRLAALKPAPVIGEEAASVSRRDLPVGESGFVWTLDPLDGTRNFVRGKPAFCSMVALLLNGRPIQSWIWQPLGRRLFYAAVDRGAFCIDEAGERRVYCKAPAVDITKLAGTGNVAGLYEPTKSRVKAKLTQLAGRHFNGSAGIQACMIVEGAADFMMHGRATPWDYAPVDLLCREAGGFAAGLAHGQRFHLGFDGPFMASSSKAGWDCVRAAIWA
jgi:fructose-1,6-bisphosphatase/inositol monophosphatase family enzyme